MSYQAITDIITAQKTSELQLSATVKDSPKQSSVSFADFLATYNSRENANDDVKTIEPVKAEESAGKTVTEESVSESKVENGKGSDAAEKTEKSNSSDSLEQKKDDKKISEKDSHNLNQNAQKIEAKKDSDTSEKLAKSDKNAKKDEKDPKKISKKDFDRLDQLTKNDFAQAEITEDSQKLALLNQNSQEKNLKNQIKAENDSEKDDLELKVRDSVQNQGIEKLALAKEDKAEDMQFDFSDKNQAEKKEFALDKDGKIKVEDLRSQSSDNISDKKSVLKTSEIKLNGENTAVMSVELNPNAEADVLSLNTQTAASNGSNFQAMLSNQLQNLAPEFVKAGNLVLKDNNQGSINLILHPDDLGNVKIHLSLDGKTLSGQITVATKEALQVFKDNAETLREAFIKNGFDAANFDVAMNNGGSFNQNMGFEGQNDGSNLFAKHAYGNSAGSLSAELDSILENAEDISNYSVNIVA